MEVKLVMVFLMKDRINPKVQKLLLGFASGVMIASSIWSLRTPSIEMAEEQGKVSWIPVALIMKTQENI